MPGIRPFRFALKAISLLFALFLLAMFAYQQYENVRQQNEAAGRRAEDAQRGYGLEVIPAQFETLDSPEQVYEWFIGELSTRRGSIVHESREASTIYVYFTLPGRAEVLSCTIWTSPELQGKTGIQLDTPDR
jgi:hypothetical protein